MNFGIILEPFCISNESIYQIGRFMHCVGRLLRLPYIDPALWHDELSINRFMRGAGRLLRFMYTDRYLHLVVATSMPP